MQNGYPCPNPTCPHVFPPTAVAGVSALTCPKCGSLFQFRAATPVAPMPSYPVSRPAPPGYAMPPPAPAAAWGAPAPVVRPVAPPPAAVVRPAAPPPAPPPPPSEKSAFALDSQPDLMVKPPRRKSGNGVLIVTLVLLFLGAAVGGGVYFAYTNGFRFQMVVSPNTTEKDDGDKASKLETGAAVRTETLKGERAVYTLRVREGTWKRDDVAKKEYKADLAVQLMDRSTGDGSGSLMVLILPKTDDLKSAVDAALATVNDQKKEYREKKTLKMEVADASNGKPTDTEGTIGDTAGHILKLRVQETEKRVRFVVLGVIRQPSNVLLVECEGAWDNRANWEDAFDQILASVRVKVGKK